MMMYHQTKLGCQGINNSEIIVERVILGSYDPHCDLDLEYTVTDILKIRCDLDHSNTILFHRTLKTYDAVLSNQGWLQTDQQFPRYNRNVIF